MLFWIIGAVLCGATALIVALPAIRGRAGQSNDRQSDIAVYKDQLKELETDLARGLIAPAEAETARAEIGRRLLAASDAAPDDAPSQVSSKTARTTLMIVIAMAFAGAAGVYGTMGAPGYGDQPLASREENRQPRLDQVAAEARVAEEMAASIVTPNERDADLLAQLREALAERPDQRGFEILSSTLVGLGDFQGARAATEQVVALKGDAATTEDLAGLAELMIFAARGYVSQEASDTLDEILFRDPDNPRARFYSGVSAGQDGRPALAIEIWAAILEDAPAGAPYRGPVEDAIRDMVNRTGLPLPPGMLRGPSAEDIEAAGEMSAEDRQDMIKNMVAGLEDRLSTEGGPVEEWARLIRSLAILGDLDRAAIIYSEALTRFETDAAAVELLSATATFAGIGE